MAYRTTIKNAGDLTTEHIAGNESEFIIETTKFVNSQQQTVQTFADLRGISTKSQIINVIGTGSFERQAYVAQVDDNLNTIVTTDQTYAYVRHPGTLFVRIPNGASVAVSNIDTMQTGAGGRIAVDSLGQRFPRLSEFNKFISASTQSNIADPGLRAIMDGDVFCLRNEDRYTDPGTGQVRSRCWNDPDKYLIIGETGDACEQIWWTGGLGVKTAAGATSCVRIPNAYIDPDAAFSVTILVASMPGNTVSGRPLVMIGSQHGTTMQSRVLLAQTGAAETRATWNTTDAGFSLAGICPYVVTASAATGAGGITTYYRDCAKVLDIAKVAGTIYDDDHVIGGYWDETGGVWVSYKGFYILGVIIHDRGLTGAEAVELERALIEPTKVSGAVSIGQSNNGLSGGAVPDAPPMPDYRSAQNETSYAGQGTGWGPISASEYFGQPLGGASDGYSVTQGIAPSLPGYVFFKITYGGHTLPAFYDWTGTDYDLIFEPLMRAAWQLGRCVDLKHIFIISGESEADVSTPSATVQASWAECAARYRRGFEANWYNRNNIRMTVGTAQQSICGDPPCRNAACARGTSGVCRC
jgi:hypothetical protein